MSKSRLWLESELAVKAALEQMPEPHRLRLREVAEAEFLELVSEIRSLRERYVAEDEQRDYGPLARQFVTTNLKLFRAVSLFLLGVKR